MKKFAVLVAMAGLIGSSAMAQAIKTQEQVSVTTATCTESVQESVVGGAVGGVAGGLAGRAIGSALGSKSLGTWLGGAAGALAGNEMAKTTIYQCDVVVQGTKPYLVHFQGNVKPVVGQSRLLLVMEDGSVRLH